MSGSDRPIWFAGDLGDPAAEAIAAALPAAETRLLDCPASLPSLWPAIDAKSPRIMVLHRANLVMGDADRLAQLKRRLGPTRPVVLCVGPYARYADIERWSGVVDRVLPEAVAVETIGRHVGLPEPSHTAGRGRAVAVVSSQTELRATWAAILIAGGYEVVEAVQPETAPGGMVTLWDVPVLEPGWPGRLTARAATSPLVASIGFLDRATRDLARAAGASACLDMPADLADLMLAVDRVAGIRRDSPHPNPPAPMRPPTRRTTGRLKR